MKIRSNINPMKQQWRNMLVLGCVLGVVHATLAQNISQPATGMNDTFVYSQVMDRNGTLYAATGGLGVFVLDQSGGKTWQPMNEGFATTIIYALAFDANEDLIAGTDEGIYRYNKALKRWTAIGNELRNRSVSTLTVTSAGAIFVATESDGLYRSNDNGASWLPVNFGIDQHVVTCLATDEHKTVFAGTDGGGVYRTTDNGTAWIQLRNGLTSADVLSLAIDRNGITYAGTRGGGLFCSDNNGNQWRAVNRGMKANTVYSLAADAWGNVFVGTEIGVYYLSMDSGEWIARHEAVTSRAILSLVVKNRSTAFAGTNGAGIFTLVQ